MAKHPDDNLIGYIVATFIQDAETPGISDFTAIHASLEDAQAERNERQALSDELPYGEIQVVAELREMPRK